VPTQKEAIMEFQRRCGRSGIGLKGR
jgi:hypothetical protein